MEKGCLGPRGERCARGSWEISDEWVGPGGSFEGFDDVFWEVVVKVLWVEVCW